jgi:DNA-binding XRE family transcriptional regulator
MHVQTCMLWHLDADVHGLACFSLHMPAVPPEIDLALAAALKGFRDAAGLTQEEVAQGAGLKTTTYGRIELAQSAPAWATVRRVIDSLDISLVDLARAVEQEAG